MLAKELNVGDIDCKFFNVRRNFWASATWFSHSFCPVFLEGKGGTPDGSSAPWIDDGVPPCSLTIHEQNLSASLLGGRKRQEECFNGDRDDTVGLNSPVMPGQRRVNAGLDVKLDLTAICQGRAKPTEIQHRRDKLAFFDKQCSHVLNYHIYVGSDAVARDREILDANGITHVLNCVGLLCPEYFKGDLVYKTLWLQDSPCEDITSLLYAVFDYFEEVREKGGQVFVHCHQGVSRSTALVIAYVMWREGSSFGDALKAVKAARGVASPNMGFACQLLQCEKRLHGTPMNPKSAPRMYMVAPHSPYDPLHLVPKALLLPGADCLDSRGAFIIHRPSAVLVWIGHYCDPIMGQAAHKVAGQLVRYEKAPGPVKVFAEGNEDLEFWESFSHCLHAHSRREVVYGNGCSESIKPRKCNEDDIVRFGQLDVESRHTPTYDMDYALYEIARLGGIILPVPFACVGVNEDPRRIPVRKDKGVCSNVV